MNVPSKVAVTAACVPIEARYRDPVIAAVRARSFTCWASKNGIAVDVDLGGAMGRTLGLEARFCEIESGEHLSANELLAGTESTLRLRIESWLEGQGGASDLKS